VVPDSRGPWRLRGQQSALPGLEVDQRQPMLAFGNRSLAIAACVGIDDAKNADFTWTFFTRFPLDAAIKRGPC